MVRVRMGLCLDSALVFSNKLGYNSSAWMECASAVWRDIRSREREWERRWDCWTSWWRWVLRGVPWHLPPLQGSDDLALLAMDCDGMPYCWSPWNGCVRVLRNVSSGSPLLGLEHECLPKLPRNYVQFQILPILPDIVVSSWPLYCPGSLPLPIPLLCLWFREAEGVGDVILVLGLLVPEWVWQR